MQTLQLFCCCRCRLSLSRSLACDFVTQSMMIMLINRMIRNTYNAREEKKRENGMNSFENRPIDSLSLSLSVC